jgi:hypothetical protein
MVGRRLVCDREVVVKEGGTTAGQGVTELRQYGMRAEMTISDGVRKPETRSRGRSSIILAVKTFHLYGIKQCPEWMHGFELHRIVRIQQNYSLPDFRNGEGSGQENKWGMCVVEYVF